MAWVELQWDVPRSKCEVLSSNLFACGALGVQEDFRDGEEPPPLQPWDDPNTLVVLPERMLLKAWWEQKAFEEAQSQVAQLASGLDDVGGIVWVPVSQEDWANSWKQHFSRRVFSDKLVISPPWDAQEGDVIIEPGIAFGTGEHPTTGSCLEALAIWAEMLENKTCLDLGCGSGILAMGAAKLGLEVVGVDIESAAIVSANANAERNGLTASFSQTDIAEIDQQFDVVVANLFADKVSATVAIACAGTSSHESRTASETFLRVLCSFFVK